MKRLFLFALGILMLMPAGRLLAQDLPFTIMSPLEGEAVKSSELNIVLLTPPGQKIRLGDLTLMVDEKRIFEGITIFGNKVMLLYRQPLRAGSHKVSVKYNGRVNGRDYNHQQDILVTVRDRAQQRKLDDSLGLVKTPRTSVTGSLATEYRNNKTTGQGASLSQAQPYSFTQTADLLIRQGELQIPILIFNTSDEYQVKPKALLSRNYFSAGLNYRKWSFTGGDFTPTWDELTLSGIRVTGLRAGYSAKAIGFELVSGYTAYAREGSRRKLDSGEFYLGAVDANGNIIIPGIYERQMHAFRARFGRMDKGRAMYVAVTKSFDRVSSIENRGPAKDNIVFSLSKEHTTLNRKLNFKAGAALSLLTQDASQPVITGKQIDSLMGKKMGIAPEKYKNILVANLSTLVPGINTTSAYVQGNYQVSSTHRISVEYRRTGSLYNSLGNPFYRQDLEQTSILNTMSFFKRRLMWNVRYQMATNNLSKTGAYTLEQQTVNTGLTLAPGKKLPLMLSANINVIQQESRDPKPELTGVNLLSDRNISATLMGSYTLRTGNVSHNMTAMYNRIERLDALHDYNNSTVQIINGGLTESLDSLRISLSLNYSKLLLSNFVSPTAVTMNNVYQARLSYQTRKRSSIGVSANVSEQPASALFTTSRRMNFNADASLMFKKRWQLTVVGGVSPFRREGLAYDQYTYQGRLTYYIGKR